MALLPALARRVVQWPPHAARHVAADTGGGEAEFLYLESAAWLEVGGRRVLVNLLVNPYIDEAIISDYVMGELGIVVLDAKRGYWRFADDPPTPSGRRRPHSAGASPSWTAECSPRRCPSRSGAPRPPPAPERSPGAQTSTRSPVP